MPMFEFHCPSCDADFEELLPSSKDARKVACPRCGGKEATRKLSVFAARTAQPKPTSPACPMSAGGCCDSCSAANGSCQL
ncbi:MAG: zinc ribbon domain-containing protein [Planctomycetes bacterium]|nr:zinc ribbon domain-containing protein [Planctomycetota bacterium]